MTDLVERIISDRFICEEHENHVCDVLIVTDKNDVLHAYCMSCRDNPGIGKPWWQSGSPFGKEILSLGLRELSLK